MQVVPGSECAMQHHCLVRQSDTLAHSCDVCLPAADNGDTDRHAPRESRSLSSTSSRRDSLDSTLSSSELDDSGMGDNSMISAGDMSMSGVDGQSPSVERAGGDMSPFTVPMAAQTKDSVRLKCREMLSAALKTPRKHFTNDRCCRTVAVV